MPLFKGVNNTPNIKNVFRKNTILIFNRDEDDYWNVSTTVISFDTFTDAISQYYELENAQSPNQDIVLVKADDFENMKFSFRNYFADTTDFCDYIENGLSELSR